MSMGYRIEVARSMINTIINGGERITENKVSPSSVTENSSEATPATPQLNLPDGFSPAPSLRKLPYGPTRVRVFGYHPSKEDPIERTSKGLSRDLDAFVPVRFPPHENK